MTPELTEGCADFLIKCQSYEGGFSGYPYNEAHGGYTFCGLAACMLLGIQDRLNVPALLGWVTSRQMSAEGGFNGRTNKVVDSCYSFWQGGAFPLLHRLLHPEECAGGITYEGDEVAPNGTWLFDQRAMQKYVLLAAQHPQGGLKDKP